MQGTSVLTVLKAREKVIKRDRERQREAERADDPWGHSVVQCCESDSEEDTLMLYHHCPCVDTSRDMLV